MKMDNLGYQIILGRASDLEVMLDNIIPPPTSEKNSPPKGLRDSLLKGEGV